MSLLQRKANIMSTAATAASTETKRKLMSLRFLFAFTSCPMSTPGNSNFLLTTSAIMVLLGAARLVRVFLGETFYRKFPPVTPASELLQGTELRASGPGVDVYLCLSRYYGLSCYEPCLRHPVAYALRYPRRAYSACGGVPERVLHYPVFERVEGYDDKPSARFQRFDTVGKGIFQASELIVNGYSQGLKDARGRGYLAITRLCGHCPLDYLRKLGRRLDGLCGTRLYDGPGYPFCVPLFSVVPEDAYEFVFLKFVD